MPSHVTNVVGTSKRKCKCKFGKRTWLKHWRRGTGLHVPVKCAARGCGNYVEVGAHVRLLNTDQRIIWIVPFCQWHNKRPSNIHIPLKPGVMLCGAAKIDCA